MLKESIKAKTPHKASQEVKNVIVGVAKAQSASDLPRDRNKLNI